MKEPRSAGLLSQPGDDLLARPVVIVVEVQDDRVEREPLVAALRAAAADILEAVEQAVEPRPDRAGLLRQRVCALVGRAERARATLGGEIFAERLAGPALRTLCDRVGELDLIRAQDLMHLRLLVGPLGAVALFV